MTADLADGLPRRDSWTELLRRTLTGDEAASNQLLSEIRAYLKEFLARKYGDKAIGHQDASDVVQNCLLTIFLCGGQFRGTTDGEVRSWVQAIATTEFIDALRDEHRQVRDVAREVPLPQDSCGGIPLAADAQSPSQEALRNEEADRYQAALARLSPEDQQVLRLRIHDGLDWPEVAARMGRSEAAVKKQYFRAANRWRKELGEMP